MIRALAVWRREGQYPRGGPSDRVAAVAVFHRRGRGTALRTSGRESAYVAVTAFARDSRAIRELERDLGVVLFVRTTRRVELTAAGSRLLERSRRALAGIDRAIADARRSAQSEAGVVRIGYGPFSGSVVSRIAKALEAEDRDVSLRLT
jgi:hypothetical protein